MSACIDTAYNRPGLSKCALLRARQAPVTNSCLQSARLQFCPVLRTDCRDRLRGGLGQLTGKRVRERCETERRDERREREREI